MRTVFFIPPLSTASGGLSVIFELAATLKQSGFEVLLCGKEEIEEKATSLEVGYLNWADVSKGFGLTNKDIWCIPESWPNAMVPGIKSGARTIVYAQNWAFFFNTLPSGVHWKDLPLEFISVSQPVEWFLQNIIGVKSLGVLPPGIPDYFYNARRQELHRGDIKIAWMPRKNKALGKQIIDITQSKLLLDGLEAKVKFIEIEKLDREKVASILGESDIYLSTGFPEGLGLPALEAMAAGAIPVGFSGLGGFEYMRNPQRLEGVNLYQPNFPLPQTGWNCNGIFVSDGDTLGAGLALVKAIKTASDKASYLLWRQLQKGVETTSKNYTANVFNNKAAALWKKIINRADQSDV